MVLIMLTFLVGKKKPSSEKRLDLLLVSRNRVSTEHVIHLKESRIQLKGF